MVNAASARPLSHADRATAFLPSRRTDARPSHPGPGITQVLQLPHLPGGVCGLDGVRGTRDGVRHPGPPCHSPSHPRPGITQVVQLPHLPGGVRGLDGARGTRDGVRRARRRPSDRTARRSNHHGELRSIFRSIEDGLKVTRPAPAPVLWFRRPSPGVQHTTGSGPGEHTGADSAGVAACA